MKVTPSQLQTVISEEISAADVKPMFDKLISQLGNLDKSIDFLAAAVTGMDPFDIDIAQNAYGRFASPQRQSRVQQRAELKENTEMKLTTAQIREMVTEVLGELSEEKEKWIQGAEKDIERRGTEGVCTGDKFGSESCPAGSKRYNLAKTFRKMAKKRKKE